MHTCNEKLIQAVHRERTGHACEEADGELSGCISETETHEHVVNSRGAYGEGITGTDARQRRGDGSRRKQAPKA